MKNDNVELIQSTLAGDDNAFSLLVEKYQAPIHELALRKTETLVSPKILRKTSS